MPTYNKKAFLLPDSPSSCAMYHAKTEENGDYKLSIHDCNGGIRLRGNLNTPEGVDEAIEKLEALQCALYDFQEFIYNEYYKNI